MPTVQGFVQSLDARFDGSVGVRVLLPHSGNELRTVTIPNLDGDLSKAHMKLAQLGLLRDALSSTLPVTIQYRTDDKQGDLVEQVRALPTRSLVGRIGGSWVTVHVLGLSVRDRGPESTADPYQDEADTAFVTVMLTSGSIETYRVDLQRRYELTGHGMLAMCAEARHQRRPLRLYVHQANPKTDLRKSSVQNEPPVITGCEWEALGSGALDEVVAFIERIGRRSESYDDAEKRTLDHVWISYRTAPPMHPEGDVSANGSFEPTSGLAWLHVDSPLVETLQEALRGSLQVRLGLVGDVVHSVEVCCPLASAARPIWITFDLSPLCVDRAPACVTRPTVESPDQMTLNSMPHDVRWHGTGWFARGIWRIVVGSGGDTTIQIDGKAPCVATSTTTALAVKPEANRYDLEAGTVRSPLHTNVAHAFLDGLHEIMFDVTDHACNRPFRAQIYRIR